MATKRCTICGKIKPVTEFYREKQGKYGVKGKCKQCLNERKRNNPMQKVYQKRYYDNNRARLCEEGRNRKARNPEHSREYNKKWREEINPKRHKANTSAYGCNRRSADLGVPGTVTTDEVYEVYESTDWKCASCGTDEGVAIDHIIPLGGGGKNTKDNLQVLCKSCNSHKRNTSDRKYLYPEKFKGGCQDKKDV